MAGQDVERVVVGRIAGLYGVRGWVKVFSHTQPRENILNYTPWQLDVDGAWQTRRVVRGRMQGKGVIAQLEGCDDRDKAAMLVGAEIAIERSQLPPPAAGEYYWSDLIGLAVENREGVALGTVVALMETGANDVLVVRAAEEVTSAAPQYDTEQPVEKTERLIPFVPGVIVTEIDLKARRMVVDWDAEF